MTNDNRGDGSNRRRFLKLSGVAGAAALAGCSSSTPKKGSSTTSGGSSSGSTTSQSGGNGGSSTTALTIPARYVPSNMQWNSYAPSHFPSDSSHSVFDPFLRYNYHTDTLIPYVFQDWQINGTTLTVKLRQGDTWHDGTPVTADDVVTKYKIDKGFGYQISNYVTAAEAVDNQTVKYTITKAYRPKIIMSVLSQSWLNTPTHLKYGDFAKRFDNASSKKEKQQVQSDVQNYQPKKPVGSGPFKFESANQQKLTLTKYDKHADANNVKFEKYETSYFSSGQQEWAAMKNNAGLSSYSGFTPIRVVKTFPDWVREYKISRYNGFALAFNHSDEDFGNRNVRRAIANVIDQQKMANLSDPTKHAVTVPAGVGSFIGGTWKDNLGGDVSAYDTYTDQSKAESLLKGEGYTKKNGQWHKPNGKRFTLTIPAPAGWSDIVSLCKTTAQMLTDFGIKTKNQNVENTTFFGQYWGTSNFKVSPWFWNNSGMTKPFFSLSWILTSNTVRNQLSYPKQPEVPPMGKPDGKTSPMDVSSDLRTLATSSDQQEITKLTRKLAWAVNQTLPELPLIEKIHPTFWNTKEWNAPPADTDKQYVVGPFFWWPRTGDVSPKQ